MTKLQEAFDKAAIDLSGSTSGGWHKDVVETIRRHIAPLFDALERERDLQVAGMRLEVKRHFEAIVHNIEHLNTQAALNTAVAGLALPNEAADRAIREFGLRERLEEAKYWVAGHICENSKTCPECKHFAQLAESREGKPEGKS